jgi:hypothetical protein
MARLITAVLLVACIGAAMPETARGDGTSSKLRFSREEVELLRTIRQVEDAAGVTASLLKAKPFIDVLTSLNPMDMTITIATNDWDRLGPALKDLSTIEACKISGEIAGFLADYGSNRAKNPNRSFFNKLQARYDDRCQ